MEFWVGYKGEAYLHHIYCKVTNQIQGENQVIQSEHDVHIYIYIYVCVCVCVCVYIYSHIQKTTLRMCTSPFIN
jgi:hypothetical protein